MKLFHHPVVGDLDLPYESLPLQRGSSTSLVGYTPEPDSATGDALACSPAGPQVKPMPIVAGPGRSRLPGPEEPPTLSRRTGALPGRELFTMPKKYGVSLAVVKI